MKAFLSALLVTVLTISFFPAAGFDASAEQVSAPYVSAEHACLIDMSGRVIFEKNAHERAPMASTTKIMTALVALEKLQLDKVIRVNDGAVGVEGSSMYLEKGECASIETLLYALMLRSANDAALALAYECSGSAEAFADLMNQKAESLGLSDTHFDNPHGLDSENHYTTAYELARLAAYALENPDFAKIVSTLKYTYQTSEKSGIFVNHNKLLYSMKSCVGVKTGFTKRCGRCLVSAKDMGEYKFVAVTLNAPDDWNDHKALYAYAEKCSEFQLVARAGELLFTLPINSGKSSVAQLTNKDPLGVLTLKGEQLKTVTKLEKSLDAPIKEGQKAGVVEIYVDDELVLSSDIVVTKAVSKKKKIAFVDRIINKIKELMGKIFNGRNQNTKIFVGLRSVLAPCGRKSD